MRIRTLMVVAALAAGLVACADETPSNNGGNGGGGNGGGEGGGTSLPDACTLATKAEVEAAVGGTVAEGAVQAEVPSHYAFGEGASCMFIPDDGMVSATWITVFRATDESWSSYVTEQTEAFGSEPLMDVGDEALIDVAQIAVRSRGFAVTLQFGMYDPHGPGQQDRMVALAKTVVGRLPAA